MEAAAGCLCSVRVPLTRVSPGRRRLSAQLTAHLNAAFVPIMHCCQTTTSRRGLSDSSFDGGGRRCQAASASSTSGLTWTGGRRAPRSCFDSGAAFKDRRSSCGSEAAAAPPRPWRVSPRLPLIPAASCLPLQLLRTFCAPSARPAVH